MAKNKKKLTTAIIAGVTALALTLGGTFAWQSVSQRALNEAAETALNPGGRLHDDFYIDNSGNYNSDIYVENFADEDIFARVKLAEYMEIVVNYGTAGETLVPVVGSKTWKDDTNTDSVGASQQDAYNYEYVTHYFDQANITDDYWSWEMGSSDSGEVWFMPTFNKNKDSLVADRNGMYVNRIGGISIRDAAQYNNWTLWGQNDTKTDTAIYDNDVDTEDEVKFDLENATDYARDGHVALKEETHTTKLVGKTNGLISMAQWQTLLADGQDTADYWVYDTDGWVYWSSPIPAGESTGLLLDGIALNQTMDDTWYYAIEATGQFVTPDDIGKATGTGWYEPGEEPSADAETLLEELGANTNVEPVGPTPSDPADYPREQFPNGEEIKIHNRESLDQASVIDVYRGTVYTDITNVSANAWGVWPVWYPDGMTLTSDSGEHLSYVTENNELVIHENEPCDTLIAEYLFSGDGGEDSHAYFTLNVLNRPASEPDPEMKTLELTAAGNESSPLEVAFGEEIKLTTTVEGADLSSIHVSIPGLTCAQSREYYYDADTQTVSFDAEGWWASYLVTIQDNKGVALGHVQLPENGGEGDEGGEDDEGNEGNESYVNTVVLMEDGEPASQLRTMIQSEEELSRYIYTLTGKSSPW